MSLYNITTLQGLGKAGEGKVDPIQFSEIKMDRKGLKSEADKAEVVVGGGGGKEVVQEETEEKTEERVKSKFAVMKSSSFWGWHASGMKGPESASQRLKIAKKEAKVAKAASQPPAKQLDLAGKHPVSALMELCQKRGWKEPRFGEESGPKGFRFTVEVNGQKFQPPNFISNKKNAKKEASQHCLVTMGLLPSSTSTS